MLTTSAAYSLIYINPQYVIPAARGLYIYKCRVVGVVGGAREEGGHRHCRAVQTKPGLEEKVRRRARPSGEINTQSHIGSCSDSELFTDGRRSESLLIKICVSSSHPFINLTAAVIGVDDPLCFICSEM